MGASVEATDASDECLGLRGVLLEEEDTDEFPAEKKERQDCSEQIAATEI